MTADYPPLGVPASPDYFLALFRLDPDNHDLTPESPANWLAVWDELPWRYREGVRTVLTGIYPDHVTAADFDREFPTLDGRTVGDVCRFLADRVPRPDVRPWLNDRTAGAFLTVRHHLAAAGVDASGVGPSEPLEPYLRHHWAAFAELLRIAPGLPRLSQDRPWLLAGCGLAAAGLVAVAASLALHCVGLRAASWGVLPAGLLAVLLACMTRLLPPRRVALGGLVTFRDLARAVAVQSAA